MPVGGDLLFCLAHALFNAVSVTDAVRPYISRAFVRVAAAALSIADQLKPRTAGFTSPLDSTSPIITATEQTAPAAPVFFDMLTIQPPISQNDVR